MNSVVATAADDGPRRLTIYYICALSLVALLSVLGQFLVQRQLSRQLGDSKVVNLAGRQRMLSQRVCKCAALLADVSAMHEHNRYRDELREQLPTWRRTHDGLQQGDAELGLPNDDDPATTAVFARLNPIFDAMFAAAERLTTAEDATAVRAAASLLLAEEPKYLEAMDEIVYQYEQAGRVRVERLRVIERVLLVLTLLVLLLEGLLVFRPAAHRIRDSFVSLRRTSEELRIAKEAAENASRTKSQFMANMSHELRTPLHAVLSAAELLRTTTEEAKHGYLETIEDSSQSLLCLLNDLLDLSRIEADKMDLVNEPLAIREFLRRTISLFQAAADAKSLRLDCVVADDVPALFVADQLRLRQVLANLLSNAVKFTDAGSVTLRVAQSGGTEDEPVLRFEVVDTGIGIASADQARIFESFTQVHAAIDQSRGGAGLGLAIAAQLTARMGGRLVVGSEASSGSAFSFELKSAGSAVTRRISPESSPRLLRKSLHVLAADDSLLIRRLLADLLSQAGHRCCCVENGTQVLAEFQRGTFDQVLLDLRMPEMDGATVAAALRADERRRGLARTPIIVLTADAPAVEAILSSGDIDDCLAKPFSSEQLARAMAQRIDGRSMQATAAQSADENADRDGTSRRRRVLERLQGRSGLLNELVGLFLQDSPRLLAELQTAHAVQDRRRLRTAVHRLRGQLEMLAIDDVAHLARHVEQNCEAGAIGEIEAGLSTLRDVWPRMCREVADLSVPA